MKATRFLWSGFIVVLLAVSIPAKAALDPDLVLYLDFDEIAGDKIPDKSGKKHDGKINGSVTLDTGKHGKAARFAATAFLDLDGPGWPAADLPNAGFSLLAWVNVDTLGNDHAIFNARAADNTFLVHPEVRAEGKFRWLVRTDAAKTIFEVKAGTPKEKTWMHFAGVYDSAEGMGRLYIDGVEVGTAPGNLTVAKDWGQGARVGYNVDNARPFTGMMDDLNLWKRGLKAAEVKDIMDNGINLVTAVSPREKLATTWGAIKRAD